MVLACRGTLALIHAAVAMAAGSVQSEGATTAEEAVCLAQGHFQTRFKAAQVAVAAGSDESEADTKAEDASCLAQSRFQLAQVQAQVQRLRAAQASATLMSTVAGAVPNIESAAHKPSNKDKEKHQYLVQMGAAAAVHSGVASVSSSGLSRSVSLKKRTEVGLLSRAAHTGRTTRHKSAYFGDVTVGDPQQTFQVVYDTGSGNLIIPGTDCKSTACLTHDRFNKSASKSVSRVDCAEGSQVRGPQDEDGLTIEFGTGKVSGECYRDIICIGDICSPGAFLLSREESISPFSSFSFDGVLGLAFNLARAPSFSLMERMIGTLKNPVFSVFLSSSESEDSEISFGQVRHDRMASELFWVDVVGSAGYWEVPITDMTLDEKPQRICEGCRAAVDTGTSQLAGPSDFIRKLKALLQVKRDCSNFYSLPRLGFEIAGKILNLDPKDYVENYYNSCDVSFMDLDVPPPQGPLFVLGIPFLQKYFTVYDQQNSRVGFAVAKHKGEDSEILLSVGDAAPSRPGLLARVKARVEALMTVD